MWKSNLKNFQLFLSFLSKLSPSRIIFYTLYFILVFSYPGHNKLQQIVVSPGIVKSYTLASPKSFFYPKNDGTPAPNVSSRAVVIQDVSSKTLIYSKNPDTLLLPASITKVMTALVALDYWQDLNTVIEVKNEDRAIGQTIKLQKGERITIKNILYGLLVHSGNDASLALADNYKGGYASFVQAMNQKAKDLHLDRTTFKNPSGVEQYGHVTTARDLAVLAAYALANPILADIVDTRRIVMTDESGSIVHDLETTNELLGQIEGLKGLKTGWTTAAGECLVSYVDRDDHKIIVVVLNSLDRFGDTRLLVNWAYDHHSWIVPEL